MELRLELDPSSGTADLAIVSAGSALVRLADDGGLETAILLSLFLARRARADDITIAGSSRTADALSTYLAGWWGDEFAEVDGDLVGSRLWTLQREKMLPLTAERARAYAQEALAWIVSDGLADAVEVEAELGKSDSGVLNLGVRIVKGGKVAHRFEYLWRLLDAA